MMVVDLTVGICCSCVSLRVYDSTFQDDDATYYSYRLDFLSFLDTTISPLLDANARRVDIPRDWRL